MLIEEIAQYSNQAGVHARHGVDYVSRLQRHGGNVSFRLGAVGREGALKGRWCR